MAFSYVVLDALLLVSVDLIIYYAGGSYFTCLHYSDIQPPIFMSTFLTDCHDDRRLGSFSTKTHTNGS